MNDTKDKTVLEQENIVTQSIEMKVSKDKVISVAYVLKYDKEDSSVIENIEASNPMSFLFGSGNLLKDFEANLKNLKTGGAFDFKLTSDQAYGPISEEAKIMLPKKAFEVNGQIDNNLLQMGKQIPMMDQGGSRVKGVVVEINEENVKMDFNHPLAGQGLHFKGMVTEIREATEEEKMHGHIHMSGGCGCNDDSCSTDQKDMMGDGGGCGCGC